MHYPHVELVDCAKAVDKLLAEHRTGLLSMKEAVTILRERTGTERSDADLAALITKKAAHLGIAVVVDEH
ncbi:hypothetical protein EH240_26275 [Mesorhizobium tamadayense]|uniref:Uncharacterized protein n=1 Tax=Mesorhizobium tamadayense TaxID=425306 RepID=A0A3P3F8Q2_9HYPH|nr:hypothetical protein [Mesorhizobium tamadayense]RRH94797.1 hypothetical protein EH240_26275 [Mesorhizobium tamadayense]